MFNSIQLINFMISNVHKNNSVIITIKFHMLLGTYNEKRKPGKKW